MAGLKLQFENKLFMAVWCAALPPLLILLGVLVYLEVSVAITTLVILLLVVNIGFLAYASKVKVSYQLRTLSNLLEAITNNDFTLRGRLQSGQPLNSVQTSDDALSDLVMQINVLADSLMQQRLQAKESQLLVGKVINNIDIATCAVDARMNLRIANRAFCQLFAASSDTLIGRSIEQLKLSTLLASDGQTPVSWQFPASAGRFIVHKDQFIEQGETHQLILIKNVTHILRSEEQQAWQKLIRVISHEINNSLTPISSLSASLKKLVNQPEKQQVLNSGLDIIHERADGLIKLVSAYKNYAHLPAPTCKPTDLNALCMSVVALLADIDVTLHMPEEKTIAQVDKAQLQQVLINLLKNAHEANLTQHGKTIPNGIDLSLTATKEEICIQVKDKGTGVTNPSNLFVPFYSTKPEGSGIGLVTSRQIIEAHGGSLSLQNSPDMNGCNVLIRLPV